MDTLQQFLGMLRKVKGPDAKGEYMACCPAHDDRTQSMSVKLGDPGERGERPILVHCHANCTFDSIVAALGLKKSDMYVGGEARHGKPKGKRGTTSSGPGGPPSPQGEGLVPGMTVHTAKQPEEQKEELKIDWANPVRVYSYTDENGREVFQVVRYRYLNGPGKTFRQRMRDPGNPKANRDGYVMSVPAEKRYDILYRLPRVVEAIRDGRPVYVVEGEKDVETLERLGHVATCNPGGADGSGGGPGSQKWTDGHTARLAGADVIILPDNDGRGNGFKGQNHSWTVAMRLQGVAKRVRLIDIREACPELPEKGDITDMVEIMGDTQAMDALAKQVAATKTFDPGMVPFWLTPLEQCEQLYEKVPGYGAKDGSIVQLTQDGYKALTDFVVLPRMEVTRDNGAEKNLFFVLDGWTSTGLQLERAEVKAEALDSMNWVTGTWGMRANLLPGTTTKQKVAWCIEKVGQLTAKRVMEYGHTGWRKIRGKWAYLYQGGAVGMEGVTVTLEGLLQSYRLDGGGAEGFGQIALKDAIRESMNLLTLMKPAVAIALLGVMYLAPLREFLAQSAAEPAFALFLHGDSGTHKTTAASLALSHFGNFHVQSVPASFSDTGNQIRRKAFLLKDMPLLVDDFHPTTSAQEKRQMNAVAQTLSRAFGDGSDRGRLNADRTLESAKPPRCVAVFSGEDLPAIGASGLARFHVVDIEEGDIPVGKELTEAQEKARRGYLQRAMRGYITWLINQADRLPDGLHKMFLTYRETARKLCAGSHDRAPAAVACLMVGYVMMLRFFRDADVIDDGTVRAMAEAALRELTTSTRKQAKAAESDRPARMFIDAVREMLTSKRIYCRDLIAVDVKEPPPTVKMVGWMDQEYYYFLPELIYTEVVKVQREQGTEFPVSRKALYKQLVADGYTARSGMADDVTRGKRLDGRTVRVLWIPRTKIDGVPDGEQVAMEIPKTEADLPEGW